MLRINSISMWLIMVSCIGVFIAFVWYYCSENGGGMMEQTLQTILISLVCSIIGGVGGAFLTQRVFVKNTMDKFRDDILHKIDSFQFAALQKADSGLQPHNNILHDEHQIIIKSQQEANQSAANAYGGMKATLDVMRQQEMLREQQYRLLSPNQQMVVDLLERLNGFGRLLEDLATENRQLKERVYELSGQQKKPVPDHLAQSPKHGLSRDEPEL